MASNRPLPNCSALSRYVSRTEAGERSINPRGRPRTRTQEHYAALHAEYLRIAAWFAEKQGRPHKSDMELLTEYLGDCCERDGVRRSRVSAPSFAGKIKTLRNELSRARAMNRS